MCKFKTTSFLYSTKYVLFAYKYCEFAIKKWHYEKNYFPYILFNQIQTILSQLVQKQSSQL